MTKALALFLSLLAAPAAATTYTLTVSTIGPVSPSVVTSSNPVTGIWCGSTHTACTAVFTSGAQVTLTAVSASTTVFAGWVYSNGCSNNSSTCAVKMTSDTAVSATFNPVLGLQLHGNGGGVVTSSGGVMNCSWTNGCASGSILTQSFPKGSAIVLTEVADGSSTFTGWTGNAGCGHASTCSFTLNGYNVIVATFSSTGPYTIAVNVVGKGTVKSNPAGLNCGSTCKAAFAGNTSIALTTTAAAGYSFAGWANGGCSGLAPCIVVATTTQQGLGGAYTPTAFFYPR